MNTSIKVIQFVDKWVVDPVLMGSIVIEFVIWCTGHRVPGISWVIVGFNGGSVFYRQLLKRTYKREDRLLKIIREQEHMINQGFRLVELKRQHQNN